MGNVVALTLGNLMALFCLFTGESGWPRTAGPYLTLEPALQTDMRTAVTNTNDKKFLKVKDNFYEAIGKDKKYFLGTIGFDTYIFNSVVIIGLNWYWEAEFDANNANDSDNGKGQGVLYYFYHFDKGVRYCVCMIHDKDFDSLKFMERFKLTGK